jgi:hypothetical protein
MWEYTCVPILLSEGGHDASMRLMNALGADGWEAFAMGPAPGQPDVQYLYAKRHAEEKAIPAPAGLPSAMPAVGGNADTHVTLASRIHNRIDVAAS